MQHTYSLTRGRWANLTYEEKKAACAALLKSTNLDQKLSEYEQLATSVITHVWRTATRDANGNLSPDGSLMIWALTSASSTA